MSSSIKFTEQGHARFKVRDYTSAIQLYGKALESAKLSVHKISLHSNRAACYFKLKENQKALEELSCLLQLDQNHAGALQLRAQTFFGEKEYKAAMLDIDRLLELNPKETSYRDLQKKIKSEMSKEGDLKTIAESEESDLSDFPPQYCAPSFANIDLLSAIPETISTASAPADLKRDILEIKVSPTVASLLQTPLKLNSSELPVLEKLTISETKIIDKVENLQRMEVMNPSPVLKGPVKEFSAPSILSRMARKYRLPSTAYMHSSSAYTPSPTTGIPEQAVEGQAKDFILSKEKAKLHVESDNLSRFRDSNKSRKDSELLTGEKDTVLVEVSEGKERVEGRNEREQSLPREPLPAPEPSKARVPSRILHAVDTKNEVVKEAMEAEARRQSGGMFFQKAQDNLSLGQTSVSGVPLVALSKEMMSSLPSEKPKEKMSEWPVLPQEPEKKQNLDFSRYNKWNKLEVSDSESEEEEQPKPVYQYKVKGLSIGKFGS